MCRGTATRFSARAACIGLKNMNKPTGQSQPIVKRHVEKMFFLKSNLIVDPV
jgi:hypothetical protein